MHAVFQHCSAVAITGRNPRAASAEEIGVAAARTAVEVEAVDDVQKAIERARELTGAAAVLVITGSIYLVGEVMRTMGTEV